MGPFVGSSFSHQQKPVTLSAEVHALHAREGSPKLHVFGAFIVSTLLMRVPRLRGN